jgi:hypothetical protein
MYGKNSAIFLVVAALAATSCTKEREVPKAPDGKPMVSREADPDRVVFEADLIVPKDYVSKIKKTDLLIWDLKNSKGEVLAATIIPVPAFPATVKVSARQLLQPIPEAEHLLFSARIVKFGDESKPPIVGQLTAMVGMEPDEGKVVENKAVNQKALDKFLKKHEIAPAQELSVGAKAHAEFSPSLM